MSKIDHAGFGRLPRHVSAFYDNRGKMRLRYRRSGRPHHYFKHDPGTPEFDLELQACREGRFVQPLSGGTRRDGIADSVSREMHGEGSRVYFIAAETGQIKIGLAVCPNSRLKSLQTGSPVALRILAVCDGGAKQERAYHAHFAEHRLHGEWFEPHPDILAEIDRLQLLYRREN